VTATLMLPPLAATVDEGIPSEIWHFAGAGPSEVEDCVQLLAAIARAIAASSNLG
jgi:hypothetical protein